MRLNAGIMKVYNAGKLRVFKGQRAGTSDLVVFLKTGQVLWLEVKRDHKQTEKQKEFEEHITSCFSHYYYLVNDGCNEVEKILNKHGVRG